MSKLQKDLLRAEQELNIALKSGLPMSQVSKMYSTNIHNAYDNDRKRKTKIKNTVVGGIIGGPAGAIIGSQWDND